MKKLKIMKSIVMASTLTYIAEKPMWVFWVSEDI